jgi:hypothetical protein
MTYYGWHDLPQGLWIINEYFNSKDYFVWNSNMATMAFVELVPVTLSPGWWVQTL